MYYMSKDGTQTSVADIYLSKRDHVEKKVPKYGDSLICFSLLNVSVFLSINCLPKTFTSAIFNIHLYSFVYSVCSKGVLRSLFTKLLKTAWWDD